MPRYRNVMFSLALVGSLYGLTLCGGEQVSDEVTKQLYGAQSTCSDSTASQQSTACSGACGNNISNSSSGWGSTLCTINVKCGPGTLCTDSTTQAHTCCSPF